LVISILFVVEGSASVEELDSGEARASGLLPKWSAEEAAIDGPLLMKNLTEKEKPSLLAFCLNG